MSEEIEGFYAAYLTGKAGSGFAMFIIRAGKIVGADALGVQFDGSITLNPSGGHNVVMLSKLPANIQTIQGAMSGPSGGKIDYRFHLAPDFLNQPFVRIDGPAGPVNAKIVKVRGLND